jgi:hypothetical protein
MILSHPIGTEYLGTGEKSLNKSCICCHLPPTQVLFHFVIVGVSQIKRGILEDCRLHLVVVKFKNVSLYRSSGAYLQIN